MAIIQNPNFDSLDGWTVGEVKRGYDIPSLTNFWKHSGSHSIRFNTNCSRLQYDSYAYAKQRITIPKDYSFTFKLHFPDTIRGDQEPRVYFNGILIYTAMIKRSDRGRLPSRNWDCDDKEWDYNNNALLWTPKIDLSEYEGQTGDLEFRLYSITEVYSMTWTEEMYIDSIVETYTPVEGFIKCEAFDSNSGDTLAAHLCIDSPTACIAQSTPTTTQGLTPGSHTIYFSLDGYSPQSKTVTVVRGDTVTASVNLVPITGMISCKSTPTDALISLGKIIPGQTTTYTNTTKKTRADKPTVLSDIEPGEYGVRFDRDKYIGCTKNVTVYQGEVAYAHCELTLRPTKGSLECISSPSGALVYLDGSSSAAGMAPITIPNLLPGTHTVIFTMSGYNDCQVQQDVETGRTNSAVCALTELKGFIKCEAFDSNTGDTIAARVCIDSTTACIAQPTTTTTQGLSPGTHTIYFSLDGYTPQSKTVTVIGGQSVTASVNLVPIQVPGFDITVNVPGLLPGSNLYVAEVSKVPLTDTWWDSPFGAGMSWEGISNGLYKARELRADCRPDPSSHSGFRKDQDYVIYVGTSSISMYPGKLVHHVGDITINVDLTESYVDWLSTRVCGFMNIDPTNCPQFISALYIDLTTPIADAYVIQNHKSLYTGEPEEPTAWTYFFCALGFIPFVSGPIKIVGRSSIKMGDRLVELVNLGTKNRELGELFIDTGMITRLGAATLDELNELIRLCKIGVLDDISAYINSFEKLHYTSKLRLEWEDNILKMVTGSPNVEKIIAKGLKVEQLSYRYAKNLEKYLTDNTAAFSIDEIHQFGQYMDSGIDGLPGKYEIFSVIPDSSILELIQKYTDLSIMSHISEYFHFAKYLEYTRHELFLKEYLSGTKLLSPGTIPELLTVGSKSDYADEAINLVKTFEPEEFVQLTTKLSTSGEPTKLIGASYLDNVNLIKDIDNAEEPIVFIARTAENAIDDIAPEIFEDVVGGAADWEKRSGPIYESMGRNIADELSDDLGNIVDTPTIGWRTKAGDFLRRKYTQKVNWAKDNPKAALTIGILAIWFIIDNVPFYVYMLLKVLGMAPGDRSWQGKTHVDVIDQYKFNAIEAEKLQNWELFCENMELWKAQVDILEQFINDEKSTLEREKTYDIFVDTVAVYRVAIELKNEVHACWDEPIPESIEAKIVKIIDGDTIDIEYNDRELRVRLLGINSPEDEKYTYGCTELKEPYLIRRLLKPEDYCVDEELWYADEELYTETKRWIAEILPVGSTATFKSDSSRQFDDYGRFLAVPYTRAESANVCINSLAHGQSAVFFYDDNKQVDRELFLSFEADAKLQKIGIWADKFSLDKGWIKFISDPTAAEVYLDGEKIGNTVSNVLLWETTRGTHTYEFKKFGYIGCKGTILEVNRTHTENDPLEKSCTLEPEVIPCPRPNASFVISPSSPDINENITFDASASTAGGDESIDSYTWNFGDGTTGTGRQLVHQYVAAGNYVAKLTVRNGCRETDVATKSISIDPLIETGELTIKTYSGPGVTISGVTVYVDNIDKGNAPVTIKSLPIGAHTIRLEKTGYWGCAYCEGVACEPLTMETPCDFSVTVVKDTTKVVEVTMQKVFEIEIDSIPPGASIKVDGKSVTTTVGALSVNGKNLIEQLLNENK